MNLYEELGIPRDADESTIKRAYRQAAKCHHPDAGGKPDDFARVSAAWLVLRDPVRRARYDKTGETEDKPDQTMQAVAQNLVRAFHAGLDKALRSGRAPDTLDLAKMTLDTLAADKRDLGEQIAQTKREREQTERLAGRFEFSGNGPDFLKRHFEMTLDACDQRISALTEQERVMALTIATAEHYSCSVDKEVDALWGRSTISNIDNGATSSWGYR